MKHRNWDSIAKGSKGAMIPFGFHLLDDAANRAEAGRWHARAGFGRILPAWRHKSFPSKKPFPHETDPRPKKTSIAATVRCSTWVRLWLRPSPRPQDSSPFAPSFAWQRYSTAEVRLNTAVFLQPSMALSMSGRIFLHDPTSQLGISVGSCHLLACRAAHFASLAQPDLTLCRKRAYSDTWMDPNGYFAGCEESIKTITFSYTHAVAHRIQ